jgi:Protein of unknown function (DUF3800)
VSEHLLIYLDESGDLGFDFNQKKTTRYLVIALLVCWDEVAHLAMIRSVKRTLKNKLPKNTSELKGSNLALSIKKYFLKEINKEANWCLYAAVADKKAWVDHHISNHHREPKKKALYDEIAKRLFSQLDYLETTHCIDIVVDRSKNKDEITAFDKAIIAAVTKRLPKKARLTIKHRSSQEDAGLQAVDIFCAGIGKKYEKADLTWYAEFANRIAVEVEYKF